MRIKVNKIESFEVYRDGGSIGICFLDKAEVPHTLIFRVKNSDMGGESSVKSYCAVILEIYKPRVYVSPVTGISMSTSSRSEETLSWKQAIKILEKIRTLEYRHIDNQWVLDAMWRVANSRDHSIEFGAVG